MHRTLLTDRAFTTQTPYQRERFESVLAPVLWNLGTQLNAKEYALCLPLTAIITHTPSLPPCALPPLSSVLFVA